MSKQISDKNFHSVPVLGEDLALDFRSASPKDIVFIQPPAKDTASNSKTAGRIIQPLSSAA